VAVSRADAAGAVRSSRGPTDPGAKQRALTAAGLIAAAAAVLWLGAPICPTALFLGIPCPGCGLTRATLALVSGDIASAFRLHPLVPILAPLFLGAMLTALIDYVRGPTARKRPTSSFWSTRAGRLTAVALFVLVFGVWGLRFAGHFGGPVPIETIADFRERLLH
jgi:hypothetical protein